MSRRLAVQPGSRLVAYGLDETGRWCRSDVEGEVIVYRTENAARRAATPSRDGAPEVPATTTWSWASTVWRVGPPPLAMRVNVSATGGPEPTVTVDTASTGHPER